LKGGWDTEKVCWWAVNEIQRGTRRKKLIRQAIHSTETKDSSHKN